MTYSQSIKCVITKVVCITKIISITIAMGWRRKHPKSTWVWSLVSSGVSNGIYYV